MKQAIVIGGGISGIAAAAQLVERGFAPLLLESESMLGGRIGTQLHDRMETDLGGRNFSMEDRYLLQLLQFFGDCELSDYHFNSVSVGVGRRFDMRRRGGVLTRAKRLVGNAISIGPSALRRLAKVASAATQKPGSGLVCSPYWTHLAGQTSDPVVTSYFGDDVASKIIRPWTLRMMAAEPEEVYLGNLGPLLGRKPTAYKRVKGGMGVFLRAASSRLNVKFGHRVTNVSVASNRVVGVEGFTSDGSSFSEPADIVILATSARIAADLLESSTAGLARTLRQVTYYPVATIVGKYDDVQFAGDMSGLFLPRGYAASHIARYDENSRLRFSFAGVAARKAMVQHSIEELLDLGERTFREFGGNLGRRTSFTGKKWQTGLCAHTWLHHETVSSISAQCERIEGLVLTGDYFRGNSLEACATAAHEGVERIIPVAKDRRVKGRDDLDRAYSPVV
ncbi:MULTISPECIES: FAD-dependent oxidoreductase [unclassified Bradyrhizobium]|uniref:FAD-dependent oxidoreductase n=1 Tax=unclassified Bradyrhizobium TaxID=2631580 RepID=UPI0028E93F4C|nr:MULTISPECIES: FAD-dependent oxidoreductase [unclassified Bradyrhizobium]